MAARSIFGQSVGILEMSNLSGSGGGGSDPVEGKYVLKTGDSMTGDLSMENASVDVVGGEVKVNGAMSRILLEGGAGIRVEDGGGIVVADEGELSVDGKATLSGDLKVDGKTTAAEVTVSDLTVNAVSPNGLYVCPTEAMPPSLGT